jgi:hypothetical protein
VSACKIAVAGVGVFLNAFGDVISFSDRVNEARLDHVELTVVLVREMDSQEIINGIWVIES